MIALSAAACSSVSAPRLKRYPYTVGLYLRGLDKVPDVSIVDADCMDMQVEFDQLQLRRQVQESLREVFEEVVVLGEGSEPRADLVLEIGVRYDPRVTTRGDGWLLSGLCFALGTPLGWFIEDRSYESRSEMDLRISLPSEGGDDPAKSVAQQPLLTSRSRPAAMTFWQRADSLPHYVGGLVLPAVFLASESDSVRKSLPEIMGRELSAGLIRDLLNQADALGERHSTEFVLTDYSFKSDAGTSKLTCTWAYKPELSTGLAVEYSIGTQDYAKGALLDSGQLIGRSEPLGKVFELDLGQTSGGTLVHVRLRAQGGAEAVRSYTFRVPIAAK